MTSGALATVETARMLTFGRANIDAGVAAVRARPIALCLESARALQGVGAAIGLARPWRCSATKSAEKSEPRRSDYGENAAASVSRRPLVGGVITSGFGWRWGLVNVLRSGAHCGWQSKSAESRESRCTEMDIAGMLSSAAALLPSLGLICAKRIGWSAEETLAKFIGVRCPVCALCRG